MTHLEIPAPSTDCPENDSTPAKGKHSAIVFACCLCEEYGSTGNCLFMSDSLIEMVSQRANSVYVSRRFIMLCHADLRPNKLCLRAYRSPKRLPPLWKRKACRDVLVNEDMVGQWPPSYHINRTLSACRKHQSDIYKFYRSGDRCPMPKWAPALALRATTRVCLDKIS